MSLSEVSTSREELARVARELGDVVDVVLASGGGAGAAHPADVRRVLSSAVRLFTAAAESAAVDLAPLEDAASSTDAVVVACALLRARDLNPFDLAVWFRRDRIAG